MGSSMKTKFDDIIECLRVMNCEELNCENYELFQLQYYKAKASNGQFKCPFCPSKDEYVSDLLQHAIRVADGSISLKQRMKHFAMARYLDADFANEVKADPQILCFIEYVERELLSNAQWQLLKLAITEKREKEALDKVRKLQRQMSELRDERNALITKERTSNDELQGVRRELLKGTCEVHRGNYLPIGIKKIGEVDHDVFIREMCGMSLRRGNIVMEGVALCSLWQEKINDPQWYPFEIIEDDQGKPQRILKKDDVTLLALKEEWGEEIHNAVVEALTELHEHNPSGCYVVSELWNFEEKRKAALGEAVRHIIKAKTCNNSELINSYHILKATSYKVIYSDGIEEKTNVEKGTNEEEGTEKEEEDESDCEESDEETEDSDS